MAKELLVRISEAEHEGICIIVAEGRLSLGEGGEAIERLMSVKLAEGQRLLILDLTKTVFIDSSGLGGLVKGISRIKMRVGKAIVLPSKRISELLRVTKLDLAFDTDTSVEGAAAKLLRSKKLRLPDLNFREMYSVYRIEHGEGRDPTHECLDKIGPWPEVKAAAPDAKAARMEPDAETPPRVRPSIPIRALVVSTVLGLVIFAVILVALVWVVRQVSSPWALSLVFAVAILFSIHIVVFVLAVSGFLSEKSAAKLMNGALGKVPGLKAWLPGIASRKAPTQ